jgi:hypothetical protein
MGATNIWTKTITEGNLNISASDNILRLSVICRGGTITVTGSVNLNSIPSEPIDLSEGQGLTLSSMNVSLPLDGITISAATGSDFAEIVLSRG